MARSTPAQNPRGLASSTFRGRRRGSEAFIGLGNLGSSHLHRQEASWIAGRGRSLYQGRGGRRRLFSGQNMRCKLVLFPLLLAAWAAMPAGVALAQYGQGRPGQDSTDQEAASAKKKNDDWNLYQAPLPGKRNSGPC